MNIILKQIDRYKKFPITVKATFWFLVCSIIQKGISLIVVPIFTRLLSTEQYGQYSIYISWIQILTIITTLRLNFSVFNKGMTKFKEDKDGYTLTMQSLVTILTTIMLILYVSFRQYFNRFTGLSTFVTLAMFLELYFTPAISFWSIRKRYDFKYKSVVFITVLMALSNALLGVVAVLVSENKGVARILSCILVQFCFGAVIYIYNIGKGKKIFKWEYAKFSLLFNIPLIFHYFSTFILEQADRIMIQKMVGMSAVGVYSVAYSAGMLMMIITTSTNNALVPWLYKKLEDEQYKNIEKKFMPYLYLLVIILIIFITFAPEIIRILASIEYYEAVYIIPPVATSIFFIFIYGVFANVEFFFDANKFSMYISAFGAILNIVLNYILIPIFGFVVAGYTTLICYIVFAFSHYIYMNKVTKVKIKTKIFNTKQIVILSSILVIVAIILTLLYKYTVIRYGLIILCCVVLFLKRDLLKNLYGSVSKNI